MEKAQRFLEDRTMTTPTTVSDITRSLAAQGGQPRAGGTDLVARAGTHRAEGPFVDLREVAELRGVSHRPDGSALVGATTTIAEVAEDAVLSERFPGLVAAAGALATPQIRAVATIAGNLLQRNRCPYYRNPAFSCLQTGGEACAARNGEHLHAAVIDQGPCVAPHPSSMAVALLAYDGVVHLADGTQMPVADLYDGTDPARDHRLAPGRLITAIEVPPPTPGEGSAHHRAAGRALAEWPLVEAVARVACTDGVVTEAVVAVGAVARTPLRLTEVERALAGTRADDGPPQAAMDLIDGLCSPLPGAAYKVTLLRASVSEVLERALRVA
jgi:xanthine dehydrogenase YagS FAD-binding subunit